VQQPGEVYAQPPGDVAVSISSILHDIKAEMEAQAALQTAAALQQEEEVEYLLYIDNVGPCLDAEYEAARLECLRQAEEAEQQQQGQQEEEEAEQGSRVEGPMQGTQQEQQQQQQQQEQSQVGPKSRHSKLKASDKAPRIKAAQKQKQKQKQTPVKSSTAASGRVQKQKERPRKKEATAGAQGAPSPSKEGGMERNQEVATMAATAGVATGAEGSSVCTSTDEAVQVPADKLVGGTSTEEPVLPPSAAEAAAQAAGAAVAVDMPRDPTTAEVTAEEMEPASASVAEEAFLAAEPTRKVQVGSGRPVILRLGMHGNVRWWNKGID
jgi:hypothetical protein